MKILFLQKSTGLGGSKNCLRDTLAALREHGGAEAEVVVSAPGLLVEELDRLGVPHAEFPLPEWRRWRDRLRFGGAIRQIVAAYRGRGFDWVISNEFWWSPHAAAIARGLGARSGVLVRDGSATARKGIQYRLHGLDLVVPSSLKIAEALATDPHIAPHVEVIYDSVQLPASGGARQAELQERLAARPRVRRWLLSLGSVGPRKNQADAVRTLRELHRLGLTDLGLVLAGMFEDDYETVFRQAVAEAGMEDFVVTLGHCDDVPSLFAAAEASVLTSLREGCPRSITETLLSGRPAFAFAVEGTRDIFGEEEARFVSPRDPAALAARIAAYFHGPLDFAVPLESLRQRVAEQFSARRHAEHFLLALARR